jgi:hypothetical protein
MSEGLVGVHRVVGLSLEVQTADIEKFDVSKQKSSSRQTAEEIQGQEHSC